MEKMEKKGRGTDTMMGHLSLGEVVIPRRMLDDEEFRGELAERFAEEGASLEEFTVGEEANKINPETGYPEFFFKKLFKKLAPIAAIAAPIAFPGIGSAIGAGLGVTGAGSATLGNALLGGGLGLASGGGLKGALTGAALGGLGANIGTAAGTPLSGGLQGATQGSGILGAATRAMPSLGNVLSGGLTGGVGGSSPISSGLALSNIFSGVAQDSAIKKALAQQQAAITQAQGNIGFNPQDYMNSPDYQFQLEQGQQAMDRANAARGGFFSGNALREAQQYGQGLASGFYNDAFTRRQSETDRLNDLILQRGSLGAQGSIGRANNLSSTLADVFNPTQRYSLYGV